MQGKKQFQEKLFTTFQLSDHVPEDNFYRRLKELLPLQWIGEMKSFTSTQLRKCIMENPQESRKEWMIWIACPDSEAFSGMERAGKKNGNNNDWQFWQQHNKPLEIKDQEMFDKILEYIHLNPIVAGFVTQPEDWKYSSAKDFCGKKGLIELNFSS